MSPSSNWIPLRWPSGPLEIARLEKSRNTSLELKDTLQRWHDPSALELVLGTPVNCLVLSWAAGLPQDKEQQRTLRPLILKGQEAGLSFVGWVGAGADKATAIVRGQTAGLAAMALEDPLDSSSKFPLIPWGERSKVHWNLPAPILTFSDAVWPQVRSNAVDEGDFALAGPTGIPWVNSNGWFVQLARTLGAGKTIWISFEPPEKKSFLTTESYLLALADTETFGGRWVISLDDRLRSAMVNGTPQALDGWKRITTACNFFGKHSDWLSFRPKSVLGVVSSFSGPDAFMSGEVLNLLSRRHVPFHIIARSHLPAAPLDGLKAILYVDQDPPPQELRQKLLAFTEKGGLLMVPSTWGKLGRVFDPGSLQDRYQLFTLGNGHLAVAKKEIEDPYALAEETHLLLSRRNDLVRLWNAAAMNSFYTASPDGRRALVQIINYSLREKGEPVSVWVREAYRSARLWHLGADHPVPLPGKAEQGGQEFHLPPVSTYAAVEMEK